MTQYPYRFATGRSANINIQALSAWATATVPDSDWDVETMTAAWSTGSVLILKAVLFRYPADALAFGLQFGLRCETQLPDLPDILHEYRD